MLVKIRFNTDKDKLNSQLPPWRVIFDGKEHLSEKVTINITSWTTYDEIEPGKWKWHITCDGNIQFNPATKECLIL